MGRFNSQVHGSFRVLTWYSHILQELTVPSYVPNDTLIIGDESDILSEGPETGHGPSMLLLTGPNYSGKSVYMKQVSGLRSARVRHCLIAR